MVRLYVVHGLKQRPGPPTSRHRFGRPRRAKGFDLADPDVQLHLLDTCRLAAASDKLHARAHFAAPESSGSCSAESCGVGLHASPPFRRLREASSQVPLDLRPRRLRDRLPREAGLGAAAGAGRVPDAFPGVSEFSRVIGRAGLGPLGGLRLRRDGADVLPVGTSRGRHGHANAAEAVLARSDRRRPRLNFRVDAARSFSTDYPRRGRGAAATRLPRSTHGAAATRLPRSTHGVAAARLRGRPPRG